MLTVLENFSGEAKKKNKKKQLSYVFMYVFLHIYTGTNRILNETKYVFYIPLITKRDFAKLLLIIALQKLP